MSVRMTAADVGLIAGNLDPMTLVGTGRVGLLTTTGSYDVDRYPWAYGFWKPCISTPMPCC